MYTKYTCIVGVGEDREHALIVAPAAANSRIAFACVNIRNTCIYTYKEHHPKAAAANSRIPLACVNQWVAERQKDRETETETERQRDRGRARASV
jgi:hypothetical protein